MGLPLPDRYAASRASRIFLWLSGTGISFSSATDSHRRPAISRRLRLGSRRRDETVCDSMPGMVGKRLVRAKSGFLSNASGLPRRASDVAWKMDASTGAFTTDFTDATDEPDEPIRGIRVIRGEWIGWNQPSADTLNYACANRVWRLMAKLRRFRLFRPHNCPGESSRDSSPPRPLLDNPVSSQFAYGRPHKPDMASGAPGHRAGY